MTRESLENRDSSSWLVVRAARSTWRQAVSDGRALSRERWTRWGTGLVIGFAVTALMTVALTYVVRTLEPNGLGTWDRRLLQAISSQDQVSFVDAMVFQTPGNLLYLVPVTGLTAIIAIRWSRPLVAASAVVSYGLARAFVFLGWGIWDRARPVTVADGIAAPALHSFPSGHAVLSLTAWGFLAYLWFRASTSKGEKAFAVLLVSSWLALISFSRIRVGAHWPSDVAGGLVIGAFWLAAVVLALRRA